MKLERKHTSPSLFKGIVGKTEQFAFGRTKREAERRLRRGFARLGKPTIENAGEGKDQCPAGECHHPGLVDHLVIEGPLSRAQTNMALKHKMNLR